MPWWRRAVGADAASLVAEPGAERGTRARHPSGRHRDGTVPPPTRWPLILHGRTPRGVDFTLRPLVREDAAEFTAVRRANAAWLGPWDATSPEERTTPRTFGELVDLFDADARSGRALPFAIDRDGSIVGQLTLGNIVLGSFRSATAGYWIARSSAGLGITPTALAITMDYCFSVLSLHRIEVNIRPENVASLAVVRKLAFREEGLRRRLLHIDGQWRDHLSFALTVEDLAGRAVRERLDR